MWRVIILLACALVVADATGLIGGCDETCQDESAGKQCPPACVTCACSGHSQLTTPLAQIVPILPIRVTRILETPPPLAVRGQPAPTPIIRPPIA
ncbi:MAG: hypothetical protein NT062_28090 [Proteobacteria bacterium]|nr:hypothetical protein [Pseudomonadota bacterium]